MDLLKLKICGTLNGPPVTAPRVQMRDGRFLAYKEDGVQRANAKYKIIAVHGYGGSRHAMLGGLSEVQHLSSSFEYRGGLRGKGSKHLGR